MSTEETTRYYEDFEIGETFEFSSQTLTQEEIVEFAKQFDPQPFHIDEQQAQDSVFGGLIASGWHTAAVCTGLFVDGLVKDTESAGGRGIDELRWHKPVRPGDVLSVQMEIVEKHPSEGIPGVGETHAKITGINQNDEPVVSWTLLGMMKRRESE